MVRKHIIDTTDEFWQEIINYKKMNNFKSNNLALLDLLRKGTGTEKTLEIITPIKRVKTEHLDYSSIETSTTSSG